MASARFKSLAAVAALGLLATACSGEDDGGGGGEFPRDETLYTTGTSWGPPANWNPVSPTEVTGLNGLVYETLFMFNPETRQLDPWLAESGSWTGEDTYELTLRDNITWSDGEPMTADDVVFTAELGRIEAVPYSNIWDWMDTAEAVDERTVRFTFSEPRYQEWDNFLYNEQIVPQHIWQDFSEDEVMTIANENPVGSGPYVEHSHAQDRIAWEKRDGWWATEHLGLEVQPTYIVDIVSTGNDTALNLLQTDQVDLSVNFLPGIAQQVQSSDKIGTYYPEPPYMASANTAMLIPNTTRAPLDDPELRRALAFAIDTETIVNNVYSNIVLPSNPTGMLPIWDDFVDDSVMNELGFSYDKAQAEQILAEAGYQDTDDDGFVETPDGEAIELTLIVPAGWTDWEEAANVISDSAQAAGINVVADTPDAGAVDDARGTGEFDLMLNNWTDLSHSPWTHYNYLFHQPVLDTQTTTNFSRWESEEGWELTEQLAATPSDDTAAMQQVLSELQRVQLTEMPAIPLWHNGLWSQTNSSVWSNWPTSEPDTPTSFPTMWNDWFQMGAIYTLTELQS